MAEDSEDTNSPDLSSSDEDDDDDWEEEGLDKYEDRQDSNGEHKSEIEDVGVSKSSNRVRQKRKRKERGHRRNIKSKFDTVDDLNPEAITAQTEELERIRRLELQQSVLSHDTSRDPHTPAASIKSRTTSTGTTT